MRGQGSNCEALVIRHDGVRNLLRYFVAFHHPALPSRLNWCGCGDQALRLYRPTIRLIGQQAILMARVVSSGITEAESRRTMQTFGKVNLFHEL
ncbi:MAG: hypothetical protein A2095_06465 [Sphingomonadales bacterium GWF1_63_6]|nr:MAG: hypothetical protein A2095_06465 [Sphingomonadales bacterium GWF1_63_6]